MKIKEYYNKHKRCPMCKSDKVHRTDMEVPNHNSHEFIDTINTFKCMNCGHEGSVDRLIP